MSFCSVRPAIVAKQRARSFGGSILMVMSVKKIANHYRYQRALQAHSEFSSEYPPSLGIETTAVCNLKCNKCPVGRERVVKPENSFMKMPLFHKIIDEIHDYSHSVCLSYFGEPLINPRFFEYVQYARRKRLAVSFYSNGIALNRQISDEIVRHEVAEVAFSVDCLPQDYEFFARMKNIPPTSAKHEIERIIAQILHLRAVILKSKAATKISVIRMDAPESTPRDIYETFFSGSGISVSSGGVIDWGGTVDRVTVTRPAESIVCHFPWGISVASSGVISMCHVDYNAEHEIGDVNRQTIREIYNGEKIRAIRRMQARHDIRGLPCNKCSHTDFAIKGNNPLFQTLKFVGEAHDRYGILRRGYRSWKRLAGR